MNNKMVLNIMIVYFVILSVVLGFQLARGNKNVSAPSNNGAVLAEDRLGSAVVFYNGSPVLLSNKTQLLLDRNNPAYTPVFKNNTAYLPISFYKTVYGANTSSSVSETSATIRLDNKALVVTPKASTVVDNSDEKNIDIDIKPIVANNTVYVPVDIFARAYDKEVYIYGDMGILSSSEFTQEDNSFLDGLVSQVNDLPYVVNENNLKSVAGITGTDDMFASIENKNGEYSGQDQTESPATVLDSYNNDTIVSDNNYIYYGSTGRVEILSIDDNDIVTSISEISIADKFSVSKLILNDGCLIAVCSSTDGRAGLFIYNVEDINNISLIRQYTVSGYYKNVVISGDHIYLLSQGSLYSLYKDGHFVAPHYDDSVSGTLYLDYEKIQYFPEMGADDFVVVSAINLKTEDTPSTKAFVGAGKNIYMSNSNLYIPKARNTAFEKYENIENTSIYRYSLNRGSIISSGNVQVKGHLINAHALSENNGYCRVVTKFTDDNKKVCNVYVLNNNLEICGQANEVANDADISCAVFSDNAILLAPAAAGGNIYCVDIENPTLPKGLGVMKLSEGNTAIYKYDEQTLIVVDDGEGILKVSMYDISDFDNPKELYSQELGKTETIKSQIFNNKSGFIFDTEKNVMTVPVKITNSQQTAFEGVYVYNVFKDEGINMTGTLALDSLDNVCKFKGKLVLLSENEAVVSSMNEIKAENNISFNNDLIN